MAANYTEARFWARVDKTGDCWVWVGTCDRQGYGKVKRHNKDLLAHRLSYELLVGPIPEGLVIDHLCRNTSCVNPSHLEPVTRRENTLRGIDTEYSLLTHCRHGHEYTPENTRTNAAGRRVCRACSRVASQAHNARKMQEATR